LKAAQGAGKALSGDIWSRTTFREVGKGKDKRLVESTVRVNAGTALIGAAALTVLGIGATTTLFMAGLKTSPVVRAVNYGHWLWPDGSIASKVVEERLMGTAPTRVLILEAAYSEVHWYMSVKGAAVEISEEYYNTLGVDVAKWTGAVEFPAVTETQTALWTVTETKEKVQLNIMQRPTLAEGLGSAITAVTSVPFDIGKTVLYIGSPITYAIDQASKPIQDLKDLLRLP
jgi:hypothetical protein